MGRSESSLVVGRTPREMAWTLYPKNAAAADGGRGQRIECARRGQLVLSL